MGLDAAWVHSLQIACTQGKIFGKDIIFTYGPFGYLLTRSPVNKASLLLYDLFILCSLISIYRLFLGSSPKVVRCAMLLLVAVYIKEALGSAFPRQPFYLSLRCIGYGGSVRVFRLRFLLSAPSSEPPSFSSRK